MSGQDFRGFGGCLYYVTAVTSTASMTAGTKRSIIIVHQFDCEGVGTLRNIIPGTPGL